MYKLAGRRGNIYNLYSPHNSVQIATGAVEEKEKRDGCEGRPAFRGSIGNVGVGCQAMVVGRTFIFLEWIGVLLRIRATFKHLIRLPPRL